MGTNIYREDITMLRSVPLVSILIPNYNHSRYLDKCIQSALNQTYSNIEITLLDNCSTDDSLEVVEKYIKDGVRICRNQFNIMNISYKLLANQFCTGKYFILLCADDYLLPEFIGAAVAIMEKYSSVGYVHGEKDFVTDMDEVIELDPFYKCSFVAPGHNIMPIYMVTTVAHPAQGLIRREAFYQIEGYEMEIDHMNADRSLWFYLSYYYDAAYIRNKMCRIRVGAQTETVITQQNFQHPILCHLTINDYVKYAKMKNLPLVYKREEEAINRLAVEFIGYAGGMLYIEDKITAKAYLDYARILNRDIVENKLFQKYTKMLVTGNVDKEYIKALHNVNYQHKRNYEPPEGYEEITIEEVLKNAKC